MSEQGATTARPVAVLGAGAMGSALARALLRAGHPTTVWNRTPARTGPLESEGARVAADPAAAVAAAGLVVVCVTDYDAVDAVLARAGAALGGVAVLAVVTGGPERAEALAAWLDARGARLLDAVVQAAPEQVGTPAAAFSASGAREVFDRHRRELDALGRVVFVGE